VLALIVICILGAFVAGIVLRKSMLICTAILIPVIGHAWSNNTMMAYVEGHVYDDNCKK